jgi:hypothetical protein
MRGKNIAKCGIGDFQPLAWPPIKSYHPLGAVCALPGTLVRHVSPSIGEKNVFQEAGVAFPPGLEYGKGACVTEVAQPHNRKD